MTVKVVRRARLPADRHTPAAARALVRSAVTDAHLDELLDEALLLTTELATNGVVHANTQIDLEALADEDGLTVTVTDYSPTPLPLPLPDAQDVSTGRVVQSGAAAGGAVGYATGGPAVQGARVVSEALLGELSMPDAPQMPVELVEHGRGLALIHHFATRWGTVHRPDGKAVWYRLDRAGSGRAVEPPPPQRHTPPDPETLYWLTAGDPPGGDQGVVSAAADLLRRLCASTDATGARIRLDQADGRGSQGMAGHGHAAIEEPTETRVPVPVSRPWRAELVVSSEGPPDPYTLPLAAVVANRLALIIEIERFRDTSMRRRSWLMYLAEVSELLAQSLDVELTLALIPRLLVPRLGVWCVVHRIDEWGELRLASAVHSDEDQLPDLLHLMEQDGPDSVTARLRTSLRRAARTALPAPIDGYAMPLIARGQPLGALSIGRARDHWPDPDEAAMAEDIARRCALAVDNARIHADRNHVAQTLQESLLPSALPVIGGLSLAAQYVPSAAGVDVGGDFYDVLPLPDDGWLLVIGDVSGKGVQAASITGLVRNVIRVLVRDNRPVPELLQRVNETLIERGGGRFATLALATIGPDAARDREIRLHLAGHERPVLLRADGSTGLVGTPGTALGLLETVACPPDDVRLGPGDALVFYTDGVTERRRGNELFGLNRLETAVGKLAGLPAEAMAARLRATALGFSADPPRDDIAILALRNQRSHDS